MAYPYGAGSTLALEAKIRLVNSSKTLNYWHFKTHYLWSKDEIPQGVRRKVGSRLELPNDGGSDQKFADIVWKRRRQYENGEIIVIRCLDVHTNGHTALWEEVKSGEGGDER